jgi:hypothetical protein
MDASKGKVSVLQHCWKFLEYSEEWKSRDQEAPPPKKGPQVDLDDNDDEEDEPTPKARNKDRPDGRRKQKEQLKEEAKAKSLRKKIGDFIKST